MPALSTSAPRRTVVAAVVLALAFGPSCTSPPPAPPSGGELLVLVTIDTLPAHRVACYGAPDARTPNLDRLARSGIQVRDAVSPAPVTLPSHATILTGLDPPFHGVRDNGIFSLADSFATVPELLPDDFRKAAFVGAIPVHSQFNLDQGFDLYDDAFEPLDPRRPPERRAHDVFAAAAAWIAAGDGDSPAFVWAHVFDPHYPYTPPEPWPRVASTLALGARFDAEVSYTDHELGRFLRRVVARSVVVVADHGESLGAHGEPTHSLFVYDETQRVPLLVTGPGVEPRLETRQRRLVDVAPTVLEMGGVEPPAGPGRSVLARGESREAYVEAKEPELLRGWSPLYGIRTERWKYIRAPRPELYDLVRDPGERENVHSSHPDVVDRLSELLDEVHEGAAEMRMEAIRPETAEQLAALGYIATVQPGTGSGGMDPKDGVHAAAALFRGIDAYSAGDLPRARTHLTRAIQLDPKSKDAHSYLAGIHLETGRYELAAEHARYALDLPPRWGEAMARRTLGFSLVALGRTEEGLAHLHEALRLQPADDELRDTVRRLEEGG